MVLELLALDRRRFGVAGRVVLLGTPLLTYASGGAGRDGWRQAGVLDPGLSYDQKITGREDVSLVGSWWTIVWVMLSILVWIALFALVPPLVGLNEPTLPSSRWLWASAIIGALTVALIQAAVVLVGKAFGALFTGTSSLHRMVMSFVPGVLFLNSDRDEAYNFLASVLYTESPFVKGEIKSRPSASTLAMIHLTSALDEDRRRYARRPARWTVPFLSLAMLCAAIIVETVRSSESVGLAKLAVALAFVPIPVLIYSLFQVRGTMTAVMLPWRALLFVRTVFVSVVRSAIVRHVKLRVWRDLQGLAIGVAGSVHRIEDIGVHRLPPEQYAAGEWLYETLDPAAEMFAMEQRKTSVSRHVERLLSAPDADLYDFDVWRNRVGIFASDTQLVHTVYYRHPGSLDQIARHLCRPDDELVAAMKQRVAMTRSGKS